MAWPFIIFLLTATFYNPSEGVHIQKKLKPAVVVGTVYCDTCFQHDTSKNSHFIPGATVAVECSTGEGPKPRFRREAKTDEHGEFRIPLPFSVSKNVRKIEKCSVTLIKSSEPFCAVSSRAVSSSLHLKARKQGENVHIFSAGFFSFKPDNQPEICNQKPRTEDQTSRFGSEKTSEPSSEPSSDPDPSSFPPPLQDPPVSGNQFHLPPIPLLPSLPPLPQLPPLPSLPGLPLLPPRPEKAAAIERKASELKNPDDFFFPITPPFFPPVIPPVLPQPPPLIPPVLPQPPPLIPPVLPQPPPSPLIPPVLPQPPPLPMLPPLPPVPGLSPPPSPPPPTFPVPLPPLLPFPPPSSPGFPGIPPASEKPSP